MTKNVDDMTDEELDEYVENMDCRPFVSDGGCWKYPLALLVGIVIAILIIIAAGSQAGG